MMQEAASGDALFHLGYSAFAWKTKLQTHPLTRLIGQIPSCWAEHLHDSLFSHHTQRAYLFDGTLSHCHISRHTEYLCPRW